MKLLFVLSFVGLMPACSTAPDNKSGLSAKTISVSRLFLNGTWRLISGYIITRGDSAFTDYTKNQHMIKIINGTHFAFFKHDTEVKKDSGNHFDAGGGRYELKADQYTEHLDYYSDHKFEATTYNFTVRLDHDTLIQFGHETADREIIEKYVKEQ